jgi:hypothetical protein
MFNSKHTFRLQLLAVVNVVRRFAYGLASMAIAVGVSFSTGVTKGASQDLRPLVEALARKGCAQDRNYRTIAGVPCPGPGNVGGAEADDVLRALGASTRERIQALSLQARKEDAACSRDAAAAGGTSVGPGNPQQFVQTVLRAAAEDVTSFSLPVGTMLSIPGVTQIQYEYKGLPNGPEARSFKISGHVEGDVNHANLHLQMDGDVDGDKNLYTEYTVNYRKTRSPFPAWSPFLDKPSEITPGFVRLGLDTLSSVASFSDKGEHRNGIRPWREYEYVWRAEKVGARPDDILKRSGDKLLQLAPYPYGGDWVGVGWGSETRFTESRKGFVTQFSPGLASHMKPGETSDGVLMSLNVKHETIFYLHIDFNGNVSGRGTIVYTLDPNLCAVAVLTRQVNEQINFMKYLPVIFTATRELGDLVIRRFNTAWTTTPSSVTSKVDEIIATLPPKIEPSTGKLEVEKFLAANRAVKGRNIAFADVGVTGFPQGRLWRPSGGENYPNIPNVVPVPTETSFLTGKWSQEFKLTENGWNSTPGRPPFPRELDSERILMEYLAKNLPHDASGTIKIYSKYPVCPRCTGVIEQFYWLFPKITLLVTSGG